MKRIIAALIMSLALAAPVAAETIEDAWAAYEAGEETRAFEIFSELAETGDLEAIYNLAWFMRAGIGTAPDEAGGLVLMKEAAQAGHADAQATLGFYYQLGLGVAKDIALAEQWFELASEGGSAWGMNNLAFLWVEQERNFDEAETLLRRALALDPGNPFIIDSLGWFYYKVGHYEAAIPPLCDAVQLDPGDVQLREHLGDAYWQSGRAEEARAQWQQALELSYSDDDLSPGGVDYLRSVGVESWRAAMERRIADGPDEAKVPARSLPPSAPYEPIVEDCEVPAS